MTVPTRADGRGTGVRRTVRSLLVVAVLGAVAASGPPVAAADEEDEYLPAVGGSFVSVEPSRVVDTRRAGEGPCLSGERVVAVPGVPAGAGGLVANVTVTGASGPGYLSVFAGGAELSRTSSLNFGGRETVANSVTSAVGPGGLTLYASGGCPHVIVDLVGWYAPGRPARGGSFASVEPSRVVDTRRAGEGPCLSGERVVAVPGVPAGGIVANVTVTGASGPGYLSVFAEGVERSRTSSLNFGVRETVANSVTSAVGPGGLTLYASGGCPHVIVDLVGSFTPEDPVLAGSLVPVEPSRVVDTRRAGDGPCLSGERVVAVPGVPAGAGGIVANVTVTGASGPGYLSVFAGGAERQRTSSLNFGVSETVANSVTSAVGPGGLTLYASGGCPHVIVDLVGWYSGEPEPLSGVVDMSRGDMHTCAVIDDGTVRCWGIDATSEGAGEQLGDGRQESSAFPVPVLGIDDAVSIDANLGTSCAVHADGSVSCWGWDFFATSSIGDGPGTPPTKIPGLSHVVSVAVGEVSACVVKTDGTVWCWGHPSFLGQSWSSEDRGPVQVPGVTGASELASGYFHTCARTDPGDVICWGGNFESEADGSGGELVLTEATTLAAGSSETCAVRVDDTVWCWSDSNPGSDLAQLPNLTGALEVAVVGSDVCVTGLAEQVRCQRRTLTEPEAVRSIANTEGAVALSGGEFKGCVLTDAAQARCWGWGALGLLGNGKLDSPRDSDAAVTVIRGIAP